MARAFFCEIETRHAPRQATDQFLQRSPQMIDVVYASRLSRFFQASIKGEMKLMPSRA